MNKKLITTLFIFLIFIFSIQLNIYAVIVSTDKEVNSGSESVSVSVTSQKALGAYTLKLTDTAGLTLVSATSNGEISADNKTITGSSASGITSLGTFTFKVPTVTKDTTYNVKFSITGMETPDLEEIDSETNTAVIKVIAPVVKPEEDNKEEEQKPVTKPEEDNKEEEQKPTIKPEEDNKEEQTPTTKPEEDNKEEEQKPTTKPEEDNKEEEKPVTPAKSSDTSLKSLSITPFGKISKASSGIYDITVDHSLESVNITAVANHSKAKVLSGNGEFELEEGTNNFKVIVQAEDGSKETHKIRIIRKAEEKVEPITPPNVIDEEKEKEKEEEAKKKEENEFGLTNLIITGIEITPAFDKNVYEYKAEFSEDMDMIEVIATATEEDAEVEVAGDSNLKVGENLVTIIVKSKDGEITKTYQIIVTKNEPEIVAVGTADADNVSNTIGTDLTKNQELKEGIGKIVIIAVGAVAAVIVLGIIVIVYTKNRDNDDYEKKTDDKKEKIGKDAFVVAVDEEESYRELEKLSNLRNKNNDYEEDVEEEAKNNFKEEFAEEISVDNDDEFHEVASEKIKKSKGKRFK